MELAPEAWMPRAADGTPLHGQVHRAPGARAAMLLTHGYGEHLGRHTELTEALLGRGVSVLTYDLRGHGRSPGRRAVVDAETLVQDHLVVRGQAAALTADRPLLLHGHSLGGAVVAASVLRRPRGVPGVLLSSPALVLAARPGALTRVAAGLLARVAPWAGTVRLDSADLSHDPQVVAAYDADPLVYRGRIPACTAVTMLRLGEAVLARAGQWSAPALVVQGATDRIVDAAGARRFARAAGREHSPRPEVRLVEVPDGFHELYHDTAARNVLDLTLAWVDERLAGQ